MNHLHRLYGLTLIVGLASCTWTFDDDPLDDCSDRYSECIDDLPSSAHHVCDEEWNACIEGCNGGDGWVESSYDSSNAEGDDADDGFDDEGDSEDDEGSDPD